MVWRLASVPPSSSVLPPGAGNKPKKAIQPEERAKNLDQRYVEPGVQRHGNATTIARHDDGNVSAVLTVEHAQAYLPLTPARLPGPRAAQSRGRRTIAQPAGPYRTPPWPHARPESVNCAISATCLSSRVRTKLQVSADRAAELALQSIGEEVRRLREVAGLPKAAVARTAGIDSTHLGYIEAGEREASLAVLFRVSAVLGADLRVRVYPNTGPPHLRDRHQIRMIEAFLALLPASWVRHLEVPVYRPVRGVIDAVIAHPSSGRIVSVEAQSDLRRFEQQLRWAAEKADALPSAAIWPALAPDDRVPTLSRILLLRSTRDTRELARSHAATFSAAYPADPRALLDSLVLPDVPWPGNGLLWVRVEGQAVSIIKGTPRGVPTRP